MTEQMNLDQALTNFLDALAGKNRSAATIRAYQTDIHQFITWLRGYDSGIYFPTDIDRRDITHYLTYLAERRLSGVSRAHNVAALREYFRFLVDHDELAKSPMDTVETPKRERKDRTALMREEYTAMLSYAGSSAR